MTQPDYTGRHVALLTQHGKEQVIAPILEPATGCVITHIGHVDTDAFGSFTRDIPRAGTQLEAARRKARTGMALAGLPLGLASEGSFGPDPFAGLFPWNTELVIWIDDEAGIEIVGVSQGSARNEHLTSADWDEVRAFAERQGFPKQRLVLRPNGPEDPRIHKDIAELAHLRSTFEQCLAESANQHVFIERDLRAFSSPDRMLRIGDATRDLLQRLRSRCPACQVPGFWISGHLVGLPCASCGLPTARPHSEIWTCPRCAHRLVRPSTDCLTAEPGECDYCNP